MLIDGIILKLQTELDSGLGVGNQVFEDVLPREYTFPAIVIHDYSAARDQDTGGPVDDAETNIQLDVYGTTAVSARQVREATRTMLEGFTGFLPDGDKTKVLGVYLERAMSLPYLPNADQKATGFRKVLGLRFVHRM
jgi:hypothetical protein